MIDEYETDVILAPTRPEMVEIMEDGLDLLAEHCGCTYTVKTKSQGNYEAVIDAGGGMYYQVLMTPQSDLQQERIQFDWGKMDGDTFVSAGSLNFIATTFWTDREYYATVISVNNGAGWILAFKLTQTNSYDTYLCMRGVKIQSSETSDIYVSGRIYSGDNERQMWPDNDYVNLPNGQFRVAAVDNFDNARYCVPDGKVMLYPSLITFSNKRHLGVPTIGDEPVYWMVKYTRITPWREYYVGGTKYVTLGHVSIKSLEREVET